MKKIAIFLFPILFALYLSGGQSTANDYPWPWDTFKQVSTLISDSLSTAVIDSGNVNAGGLSVSDISNGGNGFTTKVSVRDSVAAWIARSDSSLFPDGKLSIAEIQQLTTRLGELLLKSTLADSLATNYGIQELGTTWGDSSLFKAGGIAGSNLVNPFRYTGSAYFTSPVFQVLRTGATAGSLQDWISNGVKKALIDTTGNLLIGTENAGYVTTAPGIYATGSIRSEFLRGDTRVTTAEILGIADVTLRALGIANDILIGANNSRDIILEVKGRIISKNDSTLFSLEQTPANTDSSFAVLFSSGNPQTVYNATDGDTYNQSINTSDQAVFTGASGGYTFDAPIKTTAVYNKFSLQSSLPDTTGFVGGETWYSAIGDTTYIYKSNHTIRSQP